MSEEDRHDDAGPDGDVASEEDAGRQDVEEGTDPEVEAIDERIRRVETIVRALEADEVDPEDRAGRIAEGKALVEALERDLEAVEEETTEEGTAE
jgi:hypothetical protein